jgi:phage repressor protein C with HTH and peptisase S24 domain
MFLPDDYSSLEILSVHGDSMESTFYDNDLIIIDKSKKDFINGKIFIVLYDDELYVKRIFKLPQNRIILKSDNKYYPDIEVISDNFKIIGQVVKALNFKNL